MTLLVGAGGIGKTLLAQEIASALALGSQFIDETPSPRKVLMWACEDDHDELWRRQVKIAAHFQAGLDAFTENFHLVPRHGEYNVLLSTEFGKPQFTGVEKYLSEQVNDLAVDVLILDNVAQIYGGNENDRHSVTYFLNALTGMIGRARAILLLAHPSRAQGSEYSGSGAWENVARTRLYLGERLPGDTQKRDDDAEPDDCRYLCRRKANYSPRDWRRFSYRNGVLVPEALEGGAGIVGEVRKQQCERLVIAGLRKLADMGIYSREGQRSDTYLPKLLVDYKLNDGRTRQELGIAMRSLMTGGRITKSVVGKDASRHPVVALTAPD